MMEIAELVGKLGLPIALVIYFVLKDEKRDKASIDREKLNNERFTEIEDFCRTELVELTKASISSSNICAEVIRERNIRSEKIEKVIEENTKVVADFKSYLMNRNN
jgi:hypothetical protein